MFQIRSLFVILLICFFAGCSHLHHEDPRNAADRIASTAHLIKTNIKTNTFNLTAYYKNSYLNNIADNSSDNNLHCLAHNSLNVYIEGDGRSWIKGGTKMSPDPTPHNPLALKLAALDPHPMVAYLARPGQYANHSLDPYCNPLVWTHQRYSEQVIASMNHAIDILKNKCGATKIHLVGFSGGGAIVILIAARRNDVESIRTVAADLDPTAMTAYHKTLPLEGSLNPMKVAHQVAKIPQHHFIGNKDPVVPEFISENFVKAVTQNSHELVNSIAKRTVLNNFTHHEGWEEHWQELLSLPLNNL